MTTRSWCCWHRQEVLCRQVLTNSKGYTRVEQLFRFARIRGSLLSSSRRIYVNPPPQFWSGWSNWLVLMIVIDGGLSFHSVVLIWGEFLIEDESTTFIGSTNSVFTLWAACLGLEFLPEIRTNRRSKRILLWLNEDQFWMFLAYPVCWWAGRVERNLNRKTQSFWLCLNFSFPLLLLLLVSLFFDEWLRFTTAPGFCLVGDAMWGSFTWQSSLSLSLKSARTRGEGLDVASK